MTRHQEAREAPDAHTVFYTLCSCAWHSAGASIGWLHALPILHVCVQSCFREEAGGGFQSICAGAGGSQCARAAQRRFCDSAVATHAVPGRYFGNRYSANIPAILARVVTSAPSRFASIYVRYMRRGRSRFQLCFVGFSFICLCPRPRVCHRCDSSFELSVHGV